MALFRRAKTPKCTEERPSPESAAALPASASEHKDEASISGFVARSRQALENKEEITREEWRKKKTWILPGNEGTAHPLLYLSLDILERPGLLTGILAFATAIGAVAVGLIQFGYRCRVTTDLHPADYISLLTASVTHTSQNSIGLLALAMLFGTLGIWAMNSAQRRISSPIPHRPVQKKRTWGQRIWFGISWLALVAQFVAYGYTVWELGAYFGPGQALELLAFGLAVLHIGALSQWPRWGYITATVICALAVLGSFISLKCAPETPALELSNRTLVTILLLSSYLHFLIGATWIMAALEGVLDRFRAQPSSSANADDRAPETAEAPAGKEAAGDKENSSNTPKTKTCSAWWLSDFRWDLAALAFLSIVAVITGYGIGFVIETLPQSGS